MPEEGKKTCCHCASRKHTPRTAAKQAELA